MRSDKIREWLNQVADGSLSVDEAMRLLKYLPYEELEFARIDHHRNLRKGFPETIFCPGKKPEQVAVIAQKICQNQQNVLATRASQEVYQAVKALLPNAQYVEEARLIKVLVHKPEPRGLVTVITAGTADIPVALETAECLEVMGITVDRIFDVGVAGIHRLLDKIYQINRAQAVVVVAGMEGALASLVGGMTSKPVIAVPTSIGYGANFGGLSSLLSMLNTCAPGVGVVNIDNGYGAAALAYAIVNSSYESDGTFIDL